jgi:hypothetical protein
MAQACTPTIITMQFCPHCENLRNMLNTAKIQFKETTSGNCPSYPCVVLCNGSTMACTGPGYEQAQFDAIKASIGSTKNSPPSSPGTTPGTTPAKGSSVAGASSDYQIVHVPNECPKDASRFFDEQGVWYAADKDGMWTKFLPYNEKCPKPVAGTPAWKLTIWSNAVTINWGEKNPKPTIAETPVGWQHPDVELTPVLPLPPQMTTGITVALRDHKKMPSEKKIL